MRRASIAITASVLACLLLAAEKPIQLLSGRVVGVHDGDTITVLDAANQQHKIRLAEIDAPESSQAFGSRSKQALSDKVFGKSVCIRWQEQDRYGRIVGTVCVDDRRINIEMVQEGWAWHYRSYSKSEELAAAEVKARAAHLGLWADASPTPPWEFRNPPSTAQHSATGATVYVTKSGSKYHLGGCRHLSNGQIEMPLEEARKKYGPCADCKPPR